MQLIDAISIALQGTTESRLRRVASGELKLWACKYHPNGVHLDGVTPLTMDILKNPSAYARWIDVYAYESDLDLTDAVVFNKYGKRGHWIGFIGDGIVEQTAVFKRIFEIVQHSS